MKKLSLWWKFLLYSPLSQRRIRKLFSKLVALDLDEPLELPIGVIKQACGVTVYFIGRDGLGFALHEAVDSDARRYLYAQEIVEKGKETLGDRVYLEGAYIKSFRWVYRLKYLYKYIVDKRPALT